MPIWRSFFDCRRLLYYHRCFLFFRLQILLLSCGGLQIRRNGIFRPLMNANPPQQDATSRDGGADCKSAATGKLFQYYFSKTLF